MRGYKFHFASIAFLLALLVACQGPISTIPSPTATNVPSGWISFTAQTGAFDSELFVMRADGREIMQLTGGDQDYINEATSSPDGQWIALVRGLEILVIRPDGSALRQLTYNQDAEEMLSWSPDGQRLAFYSNRKGGKDIYIIRADGSEEVHLTHPGWLERYPAWSPDGQWIVFSASRRGPEVELFMVRPDGTGLVQLTHNWVWESQSEWSPNGQWIAFNTSSEAGGDLFVIRPDGFEEKELVIVPGRIISISWSPDNQWIAYVTDRDGDYEIYLIRPDGSEEIQLTNNSTNDRSPAWSPDGQWIAFVSETIENNCRVPRCEVPSEIFVIRPNGSELTQVTNDTLPKYRISWAPAGWNP